MYASVTVKILTFLLAMVAAAMILLFGILEYEGYREELAQLSQELDKLSEIHGNSLARALWEYDYETAAALLKNLESHPAFLYAELREADNTLVSSYRHPNIPDTVKPSSDLIARYELVYDDDIIVENVGYSVIAFHTQAIIDEIIENLTIRVIIVLVTLLTLTVGAIFIIRQIIGIPLNRLKETIETDEIRFVAWESRDELGDVVKAYNALQKREEQSTRKIRDYQDNLEKTVEERTRELAVKEKLLSVAMNNMSDGMYMIDQNMRFTLFNQRYKDFARLGVDLIQIGAPMEPVVRIHAKRGDYGPGEEDDVVAQRMKFLSSQEEKTMEMKITGGSSVIEVRKAPVEGGGAVVSVTDITHRKQVEAGRKDAERQLKDAFDVISSSIRYASRIQRSILPDESLLSAVAREHFVLWEPRDVVGGDVYWVRHWSGGEVILLGDCTGHGVPGAFMTLISSGALDRALLEIPPGNPARLLGRMHQMIQESLGQERPEGPSNDGLEVGACYLPFDRRSIIFSGARFSLFVADDGNVTEAKGDKCGLGYRGIPHDIKFTNHYIEVRPKARYYMTSDGIIDQIGGERQRGFGKRRFKKLLASFGEVPLAQQAGSFRQALFDYQGGEKRRDDICILGFCVGDDGPAEEKAALPAKEESYLDDRLRVGFDELDDDHEKLFRLVAVFKKSITDQDQVEMARHLTELYDYTCWHFRHEERLMQAYKYPAAGHHMGEHQALKAQVVDIQQSFKSGEGPDLSGVPEFLMEWLIHHIQTVDKKLARFLNGVA